MSFVRQFKLYSMECNDQNKIKSVIIFNFSDVKSFDIENNLIKAVKIKRKYGKKFQREIIK